MAAIDVARKMLLLEGRLENAEEGWTPTDELKEMLAQAKAIQRQVENAKFRITRSGRLAFESKDNTIQLKRRAAQLVKQAVGLVQNREMQIYQLLCNMPAVREDS